MLRITRHRFMSMLCLAICCVSCARVVESSGTGYVLNISDSEFALSDDIVVKTDCFGQEHYHSTALYADSLLYGTSIEHPDIIEVLNISNGELEKRIFIASNIVQSSSFALSVISRDSICLSRSDPAEFIILDSVGNVNTRMSGKNTGIHYFKRHKYRNDDFILCSFLAAFRPVVSKGILYEGIDPYGLYSKDRKLNRIGAFSLNEDKWISFFCNGKETDDIKRDYGFPYDLEQPYICLSDSAIVVSFPMSHSINVYDKNTFAFRGRYLIRTSPQTLFPKPKKMLVWDSCQKSWDFRRATPFYGPIMYHKKSGVYSRIVYHEAELFDDEGNPTDDASREVSIITFDENFQVVNELMLPKGSVCFNGYWALKDGLLLTDKLCGRDSMVFKKLKISIK